MDLSVVPYGEMGGSRAKAEAGAGGGRYRECMRNYAAAMGGQAYDGCGEFMPGGECGTLEALKCAACGCHRNFHRREDPRRPLLLYNGPGPQLWDKKAPPPPPPGFPAFFPPPPHALPLPFRQVHPAPFLAQQEVDKGRSGSETPPRADGEEQQARKRFRTKFTAEQKEKMQAFAERVGWRIQRHDDAALEAFCGEVGVKRHVLKVWMHNNKHALASPSPTSNPSTNPTDTDASPSPNPKPEPASAPAIRV